uniref:FHOD1 N-terminal GTPase-binding domain-containing protein n=1 Tax=Sphenodon punctatus TaxID=8508 RepID=A0A8D0HAV1_SPHPU
MATLLCRVQFLDDTDPFNSTNFPEPTRPPLYTFREDIPLATQLPGVHRLLRAPHKVLGSGRPALLLGRGRSGDFEICLKLLLWE